MKTKFLITIALSIFFLPSISGQVKKSAPTDLEQLAQKLVTQSAQVKEGDIVFISGGVRDIELLENISTNVRKVGAFPLLTLSSDRLTKRYFTDVPEKYDAQPPKLDMKIAEMADVVIIIDSNETEGLLAGVPPTRIAAVSKNADPVSQTFFKRNVRTVAVGNGLYPTEWRARRFQMNPEELSKTFWQGVNVDYTNLQSRADKLTAILAAGKRLHITNPNGTDLTVHVESRPVFSSDGMISADDIKKGGAAVAVYLPAGEVYLTPVPGTAKGKIVVKKDFFQGKEIQNLTMTFAGGKLSNMTGSGPGFDAFKAQYDLAGPDKDEFAFIDFGINDSVSIPATSGLGTWVPAGMVTVGTGNNMWAGGSISEPWSWVAFLPGSTVTLDGKAVVENGKLKF